MGAFLLALGLSLDGLGVGLSYGMRRIRIPFASMMIIALCTIVAMGSSMIFGRWVARALAFIPLRWLGALILLGIGGVQLFRVIRSKDVSGDDSAKGFSDGAYPKPEAAGRLVAKIQLPTFGVIIQILKKPDLADLDYSGIISSKEGLLLGSALAMDAFAAGIGASLSGMNLSVIFLVALTQVIIINLGHALTGILSQSLLGKTKYLPGTLLIFLALGKLF